MEEVEELFDIDLNRAAAGADELIAEKIGHDLPQAIGEVLVNMCFQLGKNGVSKFKNMFRCMKEGDWQGAAFQMKDSRWHKQTTNRCEELASIVANYKETE
jgi:lysozyme